MGYITITTCANNIFRIFFLSFFLLSVDVKKELNIAPFLRSLQSWSIVIFVESLHYQVLKSQSISHFSFL